MASADEKNENETLRWPTNLDRIRPEMKFSGVETLTRQVMADIAVARARRSGPSA